MRETPPNVCSHDTAFPAFFYFFVFFFTTSQQNGLRRWRGPWAVVRPPHPQRWGRGGRGQTASALLIYPPLATGAAGSDHSDPLLVVRQCELATWPTLTTRKSSVRSNLPIFLCEVRWPSSQFFSPCTCTLLREFFFNQRAFFQSLNLPPQVGRLVIQKSDIILHKKVQDFLTGRHKIGILLGSIFIRMVQL